MDFGLKICGMREAENILQTASFQPEYLGFIFYAKSPRYVGDKFALPFGFPENILKVGVFVNATIPEMILQSDRLHLDFLQLHGNEPVEQVRELKASGAKIIKVFSVDEQFDFEVTKPYQEYVEYFLFDTKGKYHGGNAETFDWKILDRYDQQIPFFLSGGLGPDNVREVSTLAGMNLHALDVNSRVEHSPGVKDPEKLNRLCEILQSIR
ncbi:MAG TPA: phosphoribosylanthranilate isomerase [Ohtaekwangia sp.]|nr:phosphoribosylanthranilate isomerase [Ohtaekwangia sp.]